MSFVSFQFALLLSSCWALYSVLGRRAQNVLLLICSYLFYGSWDWRFLGLLWLSTMVDYVAGQRIHRAGREGDDRGRKRWLSLSLAVNLGALGFFKYCGFFVEQAAVLLESVGVQANLPTLQIILPVGISFYTFQTLSYSIDIYRGELEPTTSWIDFAVFVAFFPQLVAGPIERARHLLPQFERARSVSATDVRDGMWLMLVGYVRKVAIADTAAWFGQPYFDRPQAYSSAELIAGLLFFSLQIYGDFSGYSNIARGCAKLLGFDLMRNFHHPYFAPNISDFWRRWHISLSTWLRDYLYIPLGGNRLGSIRTYANLMITMLLGGLWHGASWNFVIWGGLHGLYLSAHRPLRRFGQTLESRFTPALHVPIAVAGGLLTFGLVSFTWLFFRSTTMATTMAYLSGLAALNFARPEMLLPAASLAVLTLAIDLPQAIAGHEHPMARLPRLLRLPAAAALIVLLLMSHGGGQAFIYFQF